VGCVGMCGVCGYVWGCVGVSVCECVWVCVGGVWGCAVFH